MGSEALWIALKKINSSFIDGSVYNYYSAKINQYEDYTKEYKDSL